MYNTLPDGGSLVKDEEIVSAQKFPVSIATFYMQAKIVTTNKRFIAHFPKAVLGFLPMGFEDVNVSIKQISSVVVKVQYYILRLFFGIVFIVGAMGNFSSSNDGAFGWAVLMLLLGILLFGSGISPYLEVSTTGAGVVKVPVVFWKKSEAIKFSQELNRTIAEQ